MGERTLHFLELHEIAELLKKRELTASALVDHQLARIELAEKSLHSFAFLDPASARRQAERSDRKLAQGDAAPLEGTAIAVKDIFWTKDMPTAAGMPLYHNFRPTEDAAAVRLLRGAGVVNIGKLQMTEGAFAMHHPAITPPVNPWGKNLWPGASSSGCGVAVAAGLCFATIGTDTGGSIRFPCAVNGLTGLKPTWGRISCQGSFELAASMDHVGPIARSVRDVALLYSILANSPLLSGDIGTGHALKGLRVGIDREWNAEGCDDAVISAMEAAVQVLQALGASIHTLHMPDVRPAVSQWELIAGTEGAVAHAATYPARSSQYGPALRRLLSFGYETPAIEYHRALLARQELRRSLDAALADIDILLAPTLPYAAPTMERLGQLAEDPDANIRLISFTAPFNMSGHPALALPAKPADGLPVGIQLIAAHDREDILLRAGRAFQRETFWHKLHPPALAGSFAASPQAASPEDR